MIAPRTDRPRTDLGVRLEPARSFHDEGYGYDVFGLHLPAVERAKRWAMPWYERYFRVRSHGIENVPATGPAILVANHGGMLPIDAAMLWVDVRATEPNRLDEDVALELDRAAPQWVRDHVEADLAVCSQIGCSPLSIAVLRCAEVFAKGTGSQLWDYVQSRVCLRPLGFDPMINVLSSEDYARAVTFAAALRSTGVFNIGGADTLPLSAIVRRAGRRELAIPGPLLAPLYQLRTWTVVLEFRYDLNMRRFHFGGVLDGARAWRELGYRPACSLWGARPPHDNVRTMSFPN